VTFHRICKLLNSPALLHHQSVVRSLCKFIIHTLGVWWTFLNFWKKEKSTRLAYTNNQNANVYYLTTYILYSQTAATYSWYTAALFGNEKRIFKIMPKTNTQIYTTDIDHAQCIRSFLRMKINNIFLTHRQRKCKKILLTYFFDCASCSMYAYQYPLI